MVRTPKILLLTALVVACAPGVAEGAESGAAASESVDEGNEAVTFAPFATVAIGSEGRRSTDRATGPALRGELVRIEVAAACGSVPVRAISLFGRREGQPALDARHLETTQGPDSIAHVFALRPLNQDGPATIGAVGIDADPAGTGCTVKVSIGVDAEGSHAREIRAGFSKEGPVTFFAPARQCHEADVDSAMASACSAAGGVAVFDEDCNNLCSVPMANEGDIAGYDLTGFRTVDALLIAPKTSTATAEEVERRCVAAGGFVDLGFDGEAVRLCSVPVAPEGRLAGYDRSGFRMFHDVRAPEADAVADLRELRARCAAVGGRVSAGLTDEGEPAAICSLPVADPQAPLPSDLDHR
jgi:hypothetical protein